MKDNRPQGMMPNHSHQYNQHLKAQASHTLFLHAQLHGNLTYDPLQITAMTSVLPQTKNSFSLSQHQQNFFDTFGYLKIPGVLHAEMPAMSEAFNTLYGINNADIIDWMHEAHYMKSRKVLLQFIERLPELGALLDHPVINGIFTSILGENYLYRASEGNVFTGDTYWHSDLYGAHFKYRHIKILLYLEPLDANTGGFRAIPGSHHFGDKFANLLEKNVWKHEDNYGLSKDDVPCVTVPTQPGDVVVFDYRLKHATCHSGDMRRMFSICASEAFSNDDLPVLKKLVQEFLPMTNGKVYRDDFLASSPPDRYKHLQQCLSTVASD